MKGREKKEKVYGLRREGEIKRKEMKNGWMEQGERKETEKERVWFLRYNNYLLLLSFLSIYF